MRGRTSFSRVFRSESRTSVGAVTVVMAEGSPGPARVGVVAARRVGGAVARNRAKRRLREALRKATPPEGVDCVVVAGPGAVHEGFGRLVEDLGAALEEAKLMLEEDR